MAKAKKRSITVGNAYIKSTFNNTIVTLTDQDGGVIAWSSAGACGFKGSRKSTPYAAQTTSEDAVAKAKAFGLEKVHVFIQGIGSGREQAIRGLQAGGVNVESITDVTPIPHNGCRARKQRRN